MAAAEGGRSRSEERAAPVPPEVSPPSFGRSSEPCLGTPAPLQGPGPPSVFPAPHPAPSPNTHSATGMGSGRGGSPPCPRSSQFPAHSHDPHPARPGSPALGQRRSDGHRPDRRAGGAAPRERRSSPRPPHRGRARSSLCRCDGSRPRRRAPRREHPSRGGFAPIAPNDCSSLGCARALRA